MFKYFYILSFLSLPLSCEWDRKRRLNEKLKKKKNSKTFATLRRLIFVNINFHEINFLVDFFSPIQFCHISRGFIFEDEETYIISPEHFSAVARCAMCVIIGGNKGLIFVKPLTLCQLNQYKSPLLFRGQL